MSSLRIYSPPPEKGGRLFPASESLEPAAKAKKPAKAKKKKARATTAGRTPSWGDPGLEALTADLRVYGLRRMAGSELPYMQAPGDACEPWLTWWRLRHEPLKHAYTLADFTPKGRLALLRARQYPDAEIARLYPDLAAALER